MRQKKNLNKIPSGTCIARYLSLIVCLLLLSNGQSFAANSPKPVRLILDGDVQILHYPILLENGTLYLSIHTANQYLGKVFFYDDAEHVIFSSKRHYPTIIKDSRVYLSLSDIQTDYPLHYSYDDAQRTLYLTLPFDYEGDTQNDAPHGFGTATYTNGTFYEGYFIDGLRYGDGKLTYPDGSIFTGKWRDDRRHGMGVLEDPSGQITVNLWLNDCLQNGYWKDLSQAVSKFQWDDGHYYIGMHREGLFQGKGTLVMTTGTTLSGYWDNGFLVGQNTILFSNGTKFYGHFSKDDAYRVSGKLYKGLTLLTTYNDKRIPTTQSSKDFILSLHKIGDHLKFDQDIEAIYNNTLKAYDLQTAKVGVYIESIETGYHFTTGNNLVKDPYNQVVAGKFSVGSAIKLPMTFAVLKHLESNELPITTTFVDTLSGKTLNLKDVMRNAVSKSINSNFNYLVRYLGIANANRYLLESGILHSRVNGELGGADPFWSLERLKKEYGTYYVSRFTPEDFGKILRIVYDETLAGNPYMTYLNTLLLGNVYNARIPRAINYQYPVAHKTGTYIEEGQFADVGIVYHKEHPYIIVMLMDEQQDTKKCEPFMRSLTKAINDYMTTSVFVVD